MSIEEALYLAMDAHKGQVNLDGKPYILHPLRVGLSGQNDKEIIAGLLHDVIEDTKYTLQDIADKGAEREVVEARQSGKKRQSNRSKTKNLRKTFEGNRKAEG